MGGGGWGCVCVMPHSSNLVSKNRVCWKNPSLVGKFIGNCNVCKLVYFPTEFIWLVKCEGGSPLPITKLSWVAPYCIITLFHRIDGAY